MYVNILYFDDLRNNNTNIERFLVCAERITTHCVLVCYVVIDSIKLMNITFRAKSGNVIRVQTK